MKAILLVLGALSAAVIFVGCGTAVGRATGVDEKPPSLDNKAMGSMAFSAADIQKVVDTAIAGESERQDEEAARAEEVRRQEEEQRRQEQLRAEEERRQEEEAERNRMLAIYEECAEQYQYPPAGFTREDTIAHRSFIQCLRDGEFRGFVSVDRLESDWERRKVNAENAERERLLFERKRENERLLEAERRREEQQRIAEENTRRNQELANYLAQARESAIETCETEARDVYIRTMLEAQEDYSAPEREELVREIFQECTENAGIEGEVEFDPNYGDFMLREMELMMSCMEDPSPEYCNVMMMHPMEDEDVAVLAEQAEELAEEEAPVDGPAEERIAALEERVAELTELIRDLTEALQPN